MDDPDFTPEPGKVYDLSLQDYLAAPGLSKSGLSLLLDKSPLHFRREMKGATPAMENGSLVHCLALEPDRFDERYILEPELAAYEAKNPRATKKYKADMDALKAAHPERIMLQAKTFHRAAAVARGIRASGVFQNLLGGAPLCERSIWFHEEVFDEETDSLQPVLCKARPDAYHEHEKHVVVVDLKQSADASASAFARQSARLRYHVGAYMQAKAVALATGKPVVWMALVYEAETYLLAFYVYTRDKLSPGPWSPEQRCGSQAMLLGRYELHEALRLWRTCERSGVWPGYNLGRIVDIEIPRFKMREFEDGTAAAIAELGDPF